ncbi:hypothetical protein F5X98DRAFT_318628 [Xylaria grammica]|nr:hypothetical protein F5X98DRAFT_318628 [Xylaria grammica]
MSLTSRKVFLKRPVKPYAVTPHSTIKQVRFLHPGYVEKENTLLVLPALDATISDGNNADSGIRGVHHDTARVACCILADCRWDGYFSLTRDGPAIDEGPDDILLASQYFFRLDNPDEIQDGHGGGPSNEGIEQYRYPVVPSFEHFRFPPQLPPSWMGAPIPPAAIDKVSVRDQTCRLTCSSAPNEIAHIVPAAHEGWWQSNAMFLHTARPDQSMNTDCPENALLLRRDVHKLWDMHKFALVPKQGRWVVHVLDYGRTAELQDNYHNLELQPLQDVRPEFLLARFALSILSEMAIFVRQPLPRAVVMVQGGSGEAKVRSLSGKDCYALFGRPSKNRSQSPKKRSRSAATQDEDDEQRCESVDDEDAHAAWNREQLCETEMMDSEDGSSDGEEEPRGRPRKRRRFSSFSPPTPLSARGLSASGPSLAHSSAPTTDSKSLHAITTNFWGVDRVHCRKEGGKTEDMETAGFKPRSP